MKDVIPLLALIKELSDVISSKGTTPTIHCTIFEDNKGCIDLVNIPKIRPRTKHIALKYHHFRSFVQNNTISIQYIDTTRQIADIFTKALNDAQFAFLRDMLLGNSWPLENHKNGGFSMVIPQKLKVIAYQLRSLSARELFSNDICLQAHWNWTSSFQIRFFWNFVVALWFIGGL